MPTGTGKTEVVLSALRKEGYRTWVICPKSLVKQWSRQTESLRTTVFSFPEIQYHPEMVQERLLEERPDLIVLDEPKPIKSLTQVMKAMLDYKLFAPRRVILDATPLENDVSELWFLFRWLKPDLLGAYPEFMTRYVARKGHYKRLTELRELVKPFVFRPSVAAPRERRIEFLPVWAEFAGEIKQEHEFLCVRLAKALQSTSVEKAYNSLNRARGLISKLRSFLSDPLRGAAGKVEALVEFVRKHTERRGVIFVFKRETAKEICNRLKEFTDAEVYDGQLSTSRRETLRTRFNQGSLRFLVATAAGERGVDLPTGNLVVHFDLPWTRAAYDQRDRVSRLSSDATAAWIITMIQRNTVDEVMWSIVTAKEKLMLAPFKGEADELIIPKRSWGRFLNEYIAKEKRHGPVNEETGENLWWSRGRGNRP